MLLSFYSSGLMTHAGFPAERPTGTRPASGSAMGPPPLNSGRRLAAIDGDDLAFARQFQGSQKVWNQRKQIRKPIRLGAKDQDGNVPTRKVLLVWQPLIHGHEDLPAGALHEIEQSAVFLASEACFGYGPALMIRQAVLQLPRDALVEENPHPSWPARTELASSNAETAASRVTVGKSSMN